MSHYPVRYLGRQPKPKDLIGRSLYALVTPNTAWMPFEVNPDIQQQAGKQEQVPFNPRLRDTPKLDIVAPVKGQQTFVAKNAKVIGNVTLGNQTSVWYGAILRGDINAIVVGDKTNIQDNVVVHVARHSIGTGSSGAQPTIIGSAVTVGHGATLHACKIGDGCLVGMGATLLDGVVLEPGSIVAAGAILPPGTTVKTGEVWAGAPAKLLRKLSAEEKGFVAASADNYARLARQHLIENGKIFEEIYLDKHIQEEREWRNKTEIDVHMGIARDEKTQLILAARG
eukprot:GHUV01005167.1.p1 GENE.GHUV01005167.1~~GHUV01005167.1.p1  ORF type:complete len:283 (+),score=59.39 GHUV01005167.1:213-1061(+)